MNWKLVNRLIHVWIIITGLLMILSNISQNNSVGAVIDMGLIALALAGITEDVRFLGPRNDL